MDAVDKETKQFMDSAVRRVLSQLQSTRPGPHYDSPRMWWEGYSTSLCAVLRGWPDSDLGRAAAQAKHMTRGHHRSSISQVLGDDWMKPQMSGKEILVRLAAVGIIAAMVET